MTPDPGTPTAVLLDIDGTLVDSNFLHIEAWAQAFEKLKLFVPSWRIQRAIGADASELLAQLIDDQPDSIKDEAKNLHTTFYSILMPRLETFPGAREFIRAIAHQGTRVVLATSAPEHELEALQKVLGIDEFVYAITSAEDVDKAKPEPDIISVALDKCGVDANRAVMVGDSIWDVIAAGKAGVKTIGLLSGGTGRQDLMEAGASAVYEDIADLHRAADGDPFSILSSRENEHE
ncbi:HAD family hydrolase [Leifsonia kafniensis]|uniref:HAD family hydrolase n=1 Tax=Leifsonia kafniensis TaxID=475957 RepID=A0ABP7KZC6_9MICO